MAEGLLDDVAGALNSMLADAANDMFDGGDQIRWEGLSNGQLAHAIRLLMSGPGASAMTQAADALATVAEQLATLDQTLHDQLLAIGVNWQSDAGDLAQEMTGAAAAYGGTASDAGSSSSAGVAVAAGAFDTAKNTAPDVAILAGPAQVSFSGGVAGGGLTGHADDQAKRAAATGAARQRAIDSMQNYTSGAQTGLSSVQPLPPAPTIGLTTAPTNPATGPVTSVSSFTPPPLGMPGGAGGGGVGGGAPGLPGSPGIGDGGFPGDGMSAPGQPGSAGSPADGMPGGAPGFPGLGGSPGFPGGGGTPGFPGGGAPGSPGFPGGGGGGLPGTASPGPGPGTPLAPGPRSGAGEASLPGGGVAATAATVEGPGLSAGLIEDAALGTAIVGGAAGAGIAGASAARRDKGPRAGGAPVEDGAVNDGPVEGEDDRYGARQQAARALAELETEEAREARSAGMRARLAGIEPTPAAALLEPVQTRRDDEREHRNRYGVDEDMFGDPRTVVPPVLDGRDGADPADAKK